MNSFRLIAAYFSITFLVSCGGGGVAPSISKETLTGVFLDSPVQGLAYKTDSHKGITNAGGEFLYKKGETVSFYLGEVLLGETTAAGIVTPFNLFIKTDENSDEKAKTNTAANIQNELNAVRNLVRLLQTFDEDRNPANGIKIAFNSDDIPKGKIDFHQTIISFETDTAVLDILKSTRLEHTLVDEGASYLHFQRTLIDNSISEINAEKYSITGSITGLKGSITISNYGVDDITITDNDRFSFPTAILDNSSYSISIKQPPAGQLCRALNAQGTIVGINVTSIAIVCEDDSSLVIGLTSGLVGSLVLSADETNIIVSENGYFVTGLKTLPEDISILQQPEKQFCTALAVNGSINVSCTGKIYSLGGKTSGLVGEIVITESNSQQSLTVSNAFSFSNYFEEGDAYNVFIKDQPVGQICYVANGSGVFGVNNISDLAVNCAVTMYDVNVQVAGILSDIEVKINGSVIAANDSGAWSIQLPHGADYEVQVYSLTDTKSCEFNPLNIIDPVSETNISSSKIVNFKCWNNKHSLEFNVQNFISPIEIIETVNSGTQNLLSLVSGSAIIEAVPGKTYSLSIDNLLIEGQTCRFNNNMTTTVVTADTLSTTVSLICENNNYPINIQTNQFFGNARLTNIVLNKDGIADTYSISSSSTVINLPFRQKYDFEISALDMPEQNCSIANGSGTMVAATVTKMTLVCTPKLANIKVNIPSKFDHVSFVVTENNPLYIDNTNTTGEKSAIITYDHNSTNPVFIFNSAFYTSFSVQITSEQRPDTPSVYSCTLDNKDTAGKVSGVVSATTSVDVSCLPNEYKVSISVNNLKGSIVLSDLANTSLQQRTIETSGVYLLSLKRGGDYSIGILNDPVNQTCTISGSNLEIANLSSDLADVYISCEDHHKLSFKVTGLTDIVEHASELTISYSNVNPLTLEINSVNTITTSLNGVFEDSGYILSTWVSGTKLLDITISDPFLQVCNINGDKSLSLSSFSNDIEVPITCQLGINNFNLNINGAKSDLNLVYNGNSIQVMNGVKVKTVTNSLKYKDFTALSVTQPTSQICRFSDYTLIYNKQFLGGAFEKEATLNCYDTYRASLNVTGPIPAGLEITNKFTTHPGDISQSGIVFTDSLSPVDNATVYFPEKMEEEFSYEFVSNSPLCTVENAFPTPNSSQEILVNVTCTDKKFIIDANLTEISDAALKKCLTSQPNAATTEITALTTLSCTSPVDINVNGNIVSTDISSINGLSMFSALNSISFTNTHIESFQTLRYLPEMHKPGSVLNITNNTFPTLPEFYASANYSEDLKNCVKTLYTYVGEASPATNSKSISSINEITYLTCDGDVTGTAITDIKGLELLHNLKVIYLPNNLITDVSSIAKLNVLPGLYSSALRELIITNNTVSRISFVDSVTGLAYGLQDLRLLRILDLSKNSINDVGFLVEVDSSNPSLFKLNELTQLNLHGVNNSKLDRLVNETFISGIEFYNDSDSIEVADWKVPANYIFTNNIRLRVTKTDKKTYDNTSGTEFFFNLDINTDSILYHNAVVSLKFSPGKNMYDIYLQSPDGVDYLISSNFIYASDNVVEITEYFKISNVLSSDYIGKLLDPDMNGNAIGTGENQWKLKLIVSYPLTGSGFWEQNQARLTYGFTQ